VLVALQLHHLPRHTSLKLQDVVGKTFVKQHMGVECGTLRLVLDQEGVRADAAIGVPHFAHTDAATRAASKETEA
jgi:hypothetical protein